MKVARTVYRGRRRSDALLLPEREMDSGIRKIVLDAHDRRNEKTDRSALPPLTRKDAEAVVSVLAEALPKVTALIAQTK